ncbi:hypothetical protein [Kutzneria albida]|uniref:hypothetical protein n=1 Tax=Kutzneria albida TaxID=43357 RepID=UPI0011DCB518|nr:hypothetical protein [Kutzneria albida]
MPGETSNKESLEELQVTFNCELDSNKRIAAEIAYALALRYRNEDVDGVRNFDIAKIWATRAVELLDSLPSETIDQVSSTRASVGGVALPELLHSNVVRLRLNDILA